jgi:hypothetical protein
MRGKRNEKDCFHSQQTKQKAERLSESFMQNLLSWVHPGFSVYAGPPVQASEIVSLESQARYITRPVVAMDALEKQADGRLVMETPPDPRTGASSIELDAITWIHRITSHIPDPGRHCQRFYDVYSNRGRISTTPADGENDALPTALPEQDNSDVSSETRSTWARLIKKIFETDPLLCTCGGRMRADFSRFPLAPQDRNAYKDICLRPKKHLLSPDSADNICGLLRYFLLHVRGIRKKHAKPGTTVRIPTGY